jgi:flagellar motility protein MotE (MotC chaperone)
MAKNEAKKGTANPKPQGSGNKGKGILATLLTFLAVIVVIAAVFGGVFYFVIHNNVNGLAERYRSSLQGIPVLKLALPAVADPLDPKYLTEGEIRQKYQEFRKKNEELTKQLAEANSQLTEAQKYKTDYDAMKQESEKIRQEVKDRQGSLDQKELELKDLEKKVNELIANGDKEGLKEYFESVDAETAKAIYAEVVKEQQADANVKKFAQIYAAMDASAAASIFEQLGKTQIDMIAQTLETMSKENSSEILASMTPAFAAEVTKKLDALYRGN